MKKFVKFLVYTLRTINGVKDTANKVLQILLQQQVKEYNGKRGIISEMKENQFKQLNEMNLFNKVCQKYNLMRVRQKLSFIAMSEDKTVMEIFFRSIKRTYQLFLKEGIMRENLEIKKMNEEIMHNLPNNEIALMNLLLQ